MEHFFLLELIKVPSSLDVENPTSFQWRQHYLESGCWTSFIRSLV